MDDNMYEKSQLSSLRTQDLRRLISECEHEINLNERVLKANENLLKTSRGGEREAINMQRSRRQIAIWQRNLRLVNELLDDRMDEHRNKPTKIVNQKIEIEGDNYGNAAISESGNVYQSSDNNNKDSAKASSGMVIAKKTAIWIIGITLGFFLEEAIRYAISGKTIFKTDQEQVDNINPTK